MILYTVNKGKYYNIADYDSHKGMKVYVNLTNRCSCNCTFCLRQTKQMLENNTLWLKEEPSVKQIIDEFDKYDINEFEEIIFCGFGEPLIRNDDVIKVAKYLKERDPNCSIRVNTNGLSSLSNKRDITKDFKGVLDTISVSLNATTKEEYFQMTRSSFGIDSFDEMLDFAKKAKKTSKKVVLTVVDIIGEQKIKQCQKIADDLGVHLRVRPFEK
ncbi:MAG: TatD family nuclease-associated radical SAM protein [Thomasclavelia sp.]|nr:TatD family nuclease-associated radical SAM protein [Thomasclavelia sp.]